MIDNDIILTSRADGLEIGVRLILPDRRPCAVLQLSHGMCGCKERFLPFMQYMAEHGVACIANDHRGHGASVKHIEDLGYMYSSGYKGLVADMKMVSDHIRSIFPCSSQKIVHSIFRCVQFILIWIFQKQIII